jgi:tetratricopeptide (TPR) repeat protein
MRLTKLQISAAAIVLAVASQAHAQMGGGMSPSSGPAAQADATVPYRNGVAAFEAGDYDKAIRELRKARDANSSEGAIPYALGMAYSASGKKKEARQAFQSAVRTGNAPVHAYLQLGLVSLELGERDVATKQYAALEKKLAKCDSKCGDAERAQIKSAMDQLGGKLGTP